MGFDTQRRGKNKSVRDVVLQKTIESEMDGLKEEQRSTGRARSHSSSFNESDQKASIGILWPHCTWWQLGKRHSRRHGAGKEVKREASCQVERWSEDDGRGRKFCECQAVDWRSSKMAQHPYHSNPTGLTMIMMMVMMSLRLYVCSLYYNTVLVDLRLDYVAAPCACAMPGRLDRMRGFTS